MPDEVEGEPQPAEPLSRAMRIFDLSSQDVASVMGVSRQVVEEWQQVGPPADKLSKIGAIAQIADILYVRLRPGLPAAVARRSAEAYGGRNMLEVIAADEHDWLLADVQASFDYSSVA